MQKKILIGFLWVIMLGIVTVGWFEIVFSGKIYPGVAVAGAAVGGKTIPEAELATRDLPPPNLTVASSSPESEKSIEGLNFTYKDEETVKNAFSVGRSNGFLKNFQEKINLVLFGTNLPRQFEVDETSLNQEVVAIADEISSPAIEPGVLVEKGKVVVNPGQDGVVVDKGLLKAKILEQLATSSKQPISIPIKRAVSHYEEAQIEKVTKRANSLLGKSIVMQFEKEEFTYPDSKLIPLLTFSGVKKEKLTQIAESLGETVNRPPQNARFVFEGNRVREFAEGKEGIELQKDALVEEIEKSTEALIANDEKIAKISAPVIKTEPEISTEEVNDLGIKDLLGTGTSQFRGSATSRVHNIALAASRLNGLLIAPGEVFSFNRALGDISLYTGYQQAYVIRDGATVLGDGGGVCQVSTTFFRAALASGLPIVERRAHSYRVGYYEQDSKAGIDATIYSPEVDIKIKNDTGAHILIQAKTDTKNLKLAFEFYGTADGRQVEISTPRVWDIQPAPPATYTDDPTQLVGYQKQIDFAADGARAAFDYKVTKNGEVLQNRTFNSNYRPWQAKYLRGTATQ